MPYIKLDDRPIIDEHVKALSPHLNCAGDFNYAITSLIHLYLNNKMRYHHLNEMVGMLECVKLELYRKVIAPYENDKIKENGDVLVLDFLKDKNDEIMR